MSYDDARDLWSPDSNARERIDRPNSDKGTAIYTARKKLLLDYMEEDGDQVLAGKKRADLHVGLASLRSLKGR